DKVFDKSSDKSIAGKTAGMRKIDGYMPLYLDEAGGRLLMEISRFQKEFLYQVSLPAGVGSNPLGLDRGQLGNTRIVYFERAGPKVLMISPNYRYRALGGGAAERRSVEDSFARSVLWGFKIEAADPEPVHEDTSKGEAPQPGRALVDATAFFLTDAHEVVGRLPTTPPAPFPLLYAPCL